MFPAQKNTMSDAVVASAKAALDCYFTSSGLFEAASLRPVEDS